MRLLYALGVAGVVTSSVAAAQPEPEGDAPPDTTAEDSAAEGGGESDPPKEGPASEPKPRPDWGVTDALDTVSPWAPQPQGYEKWGEPKDTVSPWPADGAPPPVPAGVNARIDVRLGDDAPRPKLPPMVRGGIYDRPYLMRIGTDATAVAIGGYFDFVAAYEREEGISEGFSFEARRFNIFITSRIADRVRLTSELEFEHGTEEIALETAIVDILLHHTFNFRAGVILSPIGKFNITHDSPLYDIVDRPLVSTEIIPATLSEPGAGFFGAVFLGGGNRLTYEAYVTSGLGDGVIAADGTRIAQGKSPAVFEADNNGSPAVVTRIAYQSPDAAAVTATLGVSAYGGVYNTFEREGETLDDARWLRIVALDTDIEAGPLRLRGEVAHANVDVPSSLTDIHARNQVGAYVDGTITFFDRPMCLFERVSLATVTRVDYVDLNLDNRRVTGEAMGSEHTRLSVGLSLRPAPPTALRVVYHHDWMTDALQNPTRGAGVQVGLATYF